jgi:hypothetical protein
MSNKTALVFIAFVCLAAILVAGCTSSTATTPAQSGAAPAATTTQVSTPGVPATSGMTATGSQDPIIGKWSSPTVKGYSAQVVFGADGSFTGYLNGGSQVMKSGTWQSAGSGKYTVTISGTAAPVNWVFDANTNVAYDSAYPSIVYSRMS